MSTPSPPGPQALDNRVCYLLGKLDLVDKAAEPIRQALLTDVSVAASAVIAQPRHAHVSRQRVALRGTPGSWVSIQHSLNPDKRLVGNWGRPGAPVSRLTSLTEIAKIKTK